MPLTSQPVAVSIGRALCALCLLWAVSHQPSHAHVNFQTEPPTHIEDNFNRADSTGLGANYESPFFAGGSQFNISSNTAVRGTNGNNRASTLWATDMAANQLVRVRLVSRGSPNSFVSLFGRASGGGTAAQTGYRIRVNFNVVGFDVWTLSKVVTTVETNLGTGTLNLAAGDQLEMVMNGSTITAARIRAGVSAQVLQVTSETSIATSGKIGFGVSGTDVYTPAVLDDFAGGVIPSGGLATATPTPTATPTATAPPSIGVLDSFTRANGNIGNGWLGETAAYTITSNQLQATNGAEVFWPTTFGADQHVSVKIASALSNGNALSLYLKALNGSHAEGIIEAYYSHGMGVQIYAYRQNPNGMWSAYGNPITLSLASGDRFGARAEPSGLVSVLKNDTVVATVLVQLDPTQWNVARIGQIGLWTNAPGKLLDDFDGGTMDSSATATHPTT